MDSGLLQEELDRRFGLTLNDRAMLRRGETPPVVATRLARGWGCVRVLVAVFGLGAGAIFGWNAQPMLASAWPVWAVSLAAGLLGAVLAVVLFERRFKNTTFDQKPESHVGLLRLLVHTNAKTASDRVVLESDDGRAFSALTLEGLELPVARYRVFFINLTPTDPQPSWQAIGLELA